MLSQLKKPSELKKIKFTTSKEKSFNNIVPCIFILKRERPPRLNSSQIQQSGQTVKETQHAFRTYDIEKQTNVSDIEFCDDPESD